MAQLQEHYDELRNFVDDEQEGFVKLFSLFYKYVVELVLSLLYCLEKW